MLVFTSNVQRDRSFFVWFAKPALRKYKTPGIEGDTHSQEFHFQNYTRSSVTNTMNYYYGLGGFGGLGYGYGSSYSLGGFGGYGYGCFCPFFYGKYQSSRFYWENYHHIRTLNILNICGLIVWFSKEGTTMLCHCLNQWEFQSLDRDQISKTLHYHRLLIMMCWILTFLFHDLSELFWNKFPSWI